jgi:hypothetical protein
MLLCDTDLVCLASWSDKIYELYEFIKHINNIKVRLFIVRNIISY